MKKTKFKKVLKSGFSLMEMVVVIIIIGILIAGLTKMTGATKGAKVTTLNTNINNLATAAINWANQNNDGAYGGISISKLKQDGVLSGDWDDQGKKKNPFAGGLTITASGDENGFIITADKIPSDVCQKYHDKKIIVPAADAYDCTGGTLKAAYGTTLTTN